MANRPRHCRQLPQACYKCNMRRWMRDRAKRRKQQPEKQGQDQPAPLQPKFPDPIPDDIGNRIERACPRRPKAIRITRTLSPRPRPAAVGRSLPRGRAAIATAVADVVDVAAGRRRLPRLHALPDPGRTDRRSR